MEVVFMYLVTDEKSDILYYRRRFPTELVPYIPSKRPTGQGRKELKRSLEAKNINEPGARARYAEAEELYEAIVAKARRVADRAYDKLDEPLISFLAGRYRHDHVDSDQRLRWGREQLRAAYPSRGHPEDVYDDCRAMLEDYDVDGLVEYWRDYAFDFADALDRLLDPRDPELPTLCRALAEAACEVWLAVDAGIDKEPVQVPPKPEEPVRARKPAKGKEGASGPQVSILELYEQWAAIPGRHPKTVADWRRRVEHLVQFLGTEDVQAIAHDDLVRWRNFLRDEYTHRGKRLSAKTINGSFLGSVSALLAWAKGDGIIPKNPMREVAKVKLPKKPRTRSPGFTSEEALMILRGCLVPPTSGEKEDLRNAKRWCPWLMAYSGARIGEVTQLRKEDIFERDGIWIMNITPKAGTVKSKVFRLVPLHSHLIDQGFLEFVAERTDGPLFYNPDKRRSDSAINRQANRLGSKLSSWVRSFGIVGVLPNHAWRHHFTSAAPRHGLDPRVSKAITGHSTSDVHDKIYLEGLGDQIDVLKREIEKVPRFEVGV